MPDTGRGLRDATIAQRLNALQGTFKPMRKSRLVKPDKG